MLEINAITLHCADMSRSFDFYAALGFEASYGDRNAAFVSLRHGSNYLNLQLTEFSQVPGAWGRVVLHVESPDVIHQRCLDAGFTPEMAPSDAPWGERYFHVRDPDGHELSFAAPLDS